MSGGYFDYKQWSMFEIAEDIKEIVDKNESKEKDQYGDCVGFGLSDETIERLKTARNMLDVAAIYAQRIDWMLSGDDSEESFHKRLNEELKKYREDEKIVTPTE